MWWPFDNGATVGQLGSEGGIIVRDEEHESGARATLERDCSFAPWAVTCGVYGWFFHTRLLAPEAEASSRPCSTGWPRSSTSSRGLMILVPTLRWVRSARPSAGSWHASAKLTH